jgi:tetratricopeptide (TPR) repeat protein
MRNRVLIFGALGGMVAIAFVGLLLFAAYQVRVTSEERKARREAELQKERDEYRKDTMAAFNDPVPPSPDDAEIFQKVLDKLGSALERENNAEIENCFDMGRFVKELSRRGLFDQFPGGDTQANHSSFLQGVRNEGGFGKSLSQNSVFRWEKTKIRRVRWSADRTEAVVIAVHSSSELDDEPMRIRWWMIRSSTGWKLYDLEELEFGLRTTEFITLILNKNTIRELQKSTLQFRSAMENIREAIAALSLRNDADEAERLLEKTRRVDLPAPAAALRAIVEGRVLLDRGKPEEALEQFLEAERLHPGIPLVNFFRALALNSTERAEEALPLIRQFIAELGPDMKACIVEGTSLEQLKRKKEACESYRKALDDQPGQLQALDGLRRCLADADKAELGDRLTKAPDPGKLYGDAVELAREAGDEVAAAALLSGLRKVNPKDVQVIRESIQALVKNKKYDEAAHIFNDYLKGADKEENRLQILNIYLSLMSGADRLIEGYSSTPDKLATNAFNYLANDLEDELFDAAPENSSANVTKQLRALIDAHRKRVPDDLWLRYFEARLLQKAKDYEKAEREYRVAQALYLKTAKKFPAGEKDWEGNRFRARRVECLYELKQGLKAYQEVGPVKDTFQQLAYAYSQDKDLENLEKLIGIHHKALPDDPSGAYWTAELLYVREKYSAASDAFSKYVQMAEDEHFERRIGIEKCIRSYLRSNRVREARFMVADQKPDILPAALRAAVALADGKPGQADDILAELGKQPGGFGFVYNDPDFARLIAKPEFATLRKKYPEPQQVKPAVKG